MPTNLFHRIYISSCTVLTYEKMLFVLVTCCLCSFSALYAEKTFNLRPYPIDVIIPAAEKDKASLSRCIKSIRMFGYDIRRIIVISKDRYTNEAEWIPESAFPFSKNDIAQELLNLGSPDKNRQAKLIKRAGWYLQQLLKFYSVFVIPKISDNVLVLDCDTAFLRPTEFMSPEGFPIFHPGHEHHIPYFNHAKNMFGNFNKIYPQFSGIAHHMLFQRDVIQMMFQIIEQRHNKPFWKAFMSCIDAEDAHFSGASEYELYFNFFIGRSNQYIIQELLWENGFIENLEMRKRQGYSYISCHVYDN